MIRQTTTVRTLENLPTGMTVDSDPRMVDGECVIPRPGKPALAIKVSPECSECWGKAIIPRTLKEPGEKPVRVEQPCGCVWKALTKFEDAEKDSKGPVTIRSQQPAEAPIERNRRRAARLREEIAAAECALEQEKQEHAAKVAPFLARVTELEQGAEQAILDEAEAQRVAYGCEVQVNEARTLLDACRANLEAAEKLAADAQESFRECVEAMAPLAMGLAKAKDDVRVAQNKGGGHRHRVQVKQQRLADLRGRLEAVERDLPKVEEKPVEETPAAAEPVESCPSVFAEEALP